MLNTQRRRFAIINGDDFGFSQGVNQAIIQAYEQGVLTSTSLMVTGDAAEEAIAPILLRVYTWF
jgi:chitin disaccharide deacetylase